MFRILFRILFRIHFRILFRIILIILIRIISKSFSEPFSESFSESFKICFSLFFQRKPEKSSMAVSERKFSVLFEISKLLKKWKKEEWKESKAISKSQLLSKGLFGIFNSSKKRTKTKQYYRFCPTFTSGNPNFFHLPASLYDT